jgi:DNA-binding MarR family transcriptional regulator
MERVKPVGYILAKTFKSLKNCMVSEFKNREAELTFEQFVILNLLDLKDNVIQQDLANHMQKDKSIIVRQIDCLIEKKYVVRIPNKEDKRKKNLVLTEAGFKILIQSKKIALEVTQKLLSGVNENELEIFRNVLNKIQKNAGLEEELSVSVQINQTN